jgi:hypothetical protein
VWHCLSCFASSPVLHRGALLLSPYLYLFEACVIRGRWEVWLRGRDTSASAVSGFFRGGCRGMEREGEAGGGVVVVGAKA